jgi:hypothetical protein
VAGRIQLIAILAVAGLARFWAIVFCLPAPICRPDERRSPALSCGSSRENFHPKFFDWPTLFMYLVAAGTVVFFKIDLWLHWFRGEYHFLQVISNHPAASLSDCAADERDSRNDLLWLVFRLPIACAIAWWGSSLLHSWRCRFSTCGIRISASPM